MSEAPLNEMVTRTLPDLDEGSSSDNFQQAIADGAAGLSEIQIEDITWKVRARKQFGWAMLVLLAAQNIIVFGVLIYALVIGRLEELQIIFGIIIPATLGETAYMVKIIIEWLFRDIDYSN